MLSPPSPVERAHTRSQTIAASVVSNPETGATGVRAKVARAKRGERNPKKGTGHKGSPGRTARVQVDNADAEGRASTTHAASPLSARRATPVAAGSARAIPTAPPMLLSLARSKGTPYGGRGALRKNSQTPASRTAPPRVKPITVPSPDAIPSPPLTETSPIVSPPLRMSYVDVVKNATPPASPPATEHGGATPTPDAAPAPEVLPQFEVKGPAPSPAAAAAAGSEDTVSRDYPAEPSMREDCLLYTSPSPRD